MLESAVISIIAILGVFSVKYIYSQYRNNILKEMLEDDNIEPKLSNEEINFALKLYNKYFKSTEHPEDVDKIITEDLKIDQDSFDLDYNTFNKTNDLVSELKRRLRNWFKLKNNYEDDNVI